MLRVILNLCVLAAGLAFGLLSARFMMDTVSTGANADTGKWTEINLAGDSLNSTYLAGHFLRRGQVPPPNGVRFFVRDSDDDGNRLRGDCVTLMEGEIPSSRWWFVSADDGAARNGLDAGQVVREGDGQINISISTAPVPGNWLVPPSAGRFQVQLVLQGVLAEQPLKLPGVKRLWC
jgi:hypothetical protein